MVLGFGALVSANYFEVLGVRPALGRLLLPDDDRPGAPRVAILGHRSWQRMFGERADAIGRDVVINGLRYQIVGVAPASFRGLFNGGMVPAVAWVPIGAARDFPDSGVDRPGRDSRLLSVAGRIKAGGSIEQVAAELQAIGRQLDREYPIGQDITDPRYRAEYSISRPWVAERLTDIRMNTQMTPTINGLALAVLTCVGLVLVVACTNLANMTLARVGARRQELAVRLALGASRWRVVRESMVEQVAIALAGTAAGLAVARVLLVTTGGEMQWINVAVSVEPRIGPMVLLVAAAAGMLALVIAGVAPAWRIARSDVRETIATGGSHGSLPRWRGRRLLILAQVAVSMLLLAAAAVFINQVRLSSALDGGYDLDRIAIARVDLVNQRVDPARADALVTRVVSRLRATPGVDAVAASVGLPVGTAVVAGGSYVKRDAADQQNLARAIHVASTPSIFSTLGVAMVRGRAFTEDEASAAAPVVVINETVARRAFGRTDVVGQAIVLQRQAWVGGPPQLPRTFTIVGIAEDADASAVGRRDESSGVVYTPLATQYDRAIAFTVRTSGDPADQIGALRATIAEAAPDLAVEQLGTGRDLAGPPTTFDRISATITGVLGAFALVLALAGLYGVLSHVVASRGREIGVRMALGGTPASIRALILRDGLAPVVWGVVAGGALGVIARVSLRPMFESLVPAMDPVALGLVPLLLIAAGIVACYLPARRASAVDPNVALRQE
jgi:predicted permease